MYPLQEDVDFLEHFGKKGMRWGHRKTQTPTSSEGSGRKPGTVKTKTRVKAGLKLAAGIVGTVAAVAGAQYASKQMAQAYIRHRLPDLVRDYAARQKVEAGKALVANLF